MESQSMRHLLCLGLVGLTATFFSACGKEEEKYQPKPAVTGDKANLPSVPNVPQKPIKDGDAYTVWGASYHLRSRVNNPTISGKDITMVGYIVKTNLPDAPECAVHKKGKADPEDCKPPIPSFWIADTPNADLKESIRVMGWASNFANIHDAIKEFEKREKRPPVATPGKPIEPVTDEMWGVEIPNPLPVKGAKVKIKGEYKTTFTKATSGAVADPIMGTLTFQSMEYLEKPTEVATLPGMK
jgi:hypothetical protein